MRKKILIASVYAPSPLNEEWYRLQKKFLEKNTYLDFEFKIFTNDVQDSIFHSDEIVISNKENIGHPKGLRQIIDYMRGIQDNYHSFLILDSDCFPVIKHWDKILDSQMERFKKTIAAPIRFENLDCFPHPCAVYITKAGLNNPKLDYSYTRTKNLLSIDINEVGGALPEIMETVMPLVRTNTYNPHPVMAGIYHHTFYHHGAGSRAAQFRVIKEFNYCEHWLTHSDDQRIMTGLSEELLYAPEQFIEKLMILNSDTPHKLHSPSLRSITKSSFNFKLIAFQVISYPFISNKKRKKLKNHPYLYFRDAKGSFTKHVGKLIGIDKA